MAKTHHRDAPRRFLLRVVAPGLLCPEHVGERTERRDLLPHLASVQAEPGALRIVADDVALGGEHGAGRGNREALVFTRLVLCTEPLRDGDAVARRTVQHATLVDLGHRSVEVRERVDDNRRHPGAVVVREDEWARRARKLRYLTVVIWPSATDAPAPP